MPGGAGEEVWCDLVGPASCDGELGVVESPYDGGVHPVVEQGCEGSRLRVCHHAAPSNGGFDSAGRRTDEGAGQVLRAAVGQNDKVWVVGGVTDRGSEVVV